MKKISNTEINKKILELIIKSQDRYRLNSEEFEQFALRSEELLNNMKKKTLLCWQEREDAKEVDSEGNNFKVVEVVAPPTQTIPRYLKA